MNYVVIDFEYNQSFDFKHNEKGQSVKECPFEIIQIGAIKLNKDFEKIDVLNLYIKPQIYERMHPYVEKITGISKALLRDQKFFPENYVKFLDFINKPEITLCFWGSNDLRELYKNVAFHNLSYDELPKKFLNIQSMASEYLKCPQGQTIGLKNAIDNLGLPVTIDFHNALNDAYYTAEVFKTVKAPNLKFEKINLKFISNNEAVKNINFDIPALYKKVERIFGRKLSRKEKNTVKLIYELGKEGKYDFKEK